MQTRDFPIYSFFMQNAQTYRDKKKTIACLKVSGVKTEKGELCACMHTKNSNRMQLPDPENGNGVQAI